MPTGPTEFPKKIIAAIDIGTNSAHLVVAAMDHVGDMRILDSDKVNLRLGQAIGPDGHITEDGIARTVQAIKHMKEISAPYQATVRAVATHATREARNHKRLLADIEQASGIHVEMIDGIEEARLVFLGMRYGLVLNGVPCLGVDVGGGSTEVIVAKDDDIDFVSSIKVGAVTLTEKYFKSGYTEAAYRALREHVRSRLAPLPQEARRAAYAKALASSGTAKALAFLHAKMFSNADLAAPNGYAIPREDLFKISERFAQLLTPQKIKEATGLDQTRAEIIIAGTTVLEELTKLFKVKEWIVTSYGLREGLVADTFYRAYGPRSDAMPDIQWHSVLQFAKRLQLNEPHAVQVKRLALRLLDQIGPHARADANQDEIDANAKLLKAAAYLREAGKFISAPGYHKHSQYLLTHCRLPGFTEWERVFMGLIARFQRKSVPTVGNQYCSDLTADDVKRLQILAGILRLAAALDRTRQGRVLDIEVEMDPKPGSPMNITLLHAADQFPDVELHKARLEKNALEKSFDRKLSLSARAVAGAL